MRKFFKTLRDFLKGTWVVWLTAILIVVIGIIVMITNPHNPISIWLKELYGVSPP